MRANESALGRWDVVPETIEHDDPPRVERPADGGRPDCRERSSAGGGERATLQQVPTSPARAGAATSFGVARGRQYDTDLPGAGGLSAVLPWWRESCRPPVARASHALVAAPTRTYVAERLHELRRHLDHLREIRLHARNGDELEQSLSLRNDVLFSRLMLCQLAIDVAGELSAQRGERCDDSMGALRKLVGDRRVPAEVVGELERLLGFRNVLMHGCAARDTDRVREALDGIEPIQRFLEIVHAIATSGA